MQLSMGFIVKLPAGTMFENIVNTINKYIYYKVYSIKV